MAENIFGKDVTTRYYQQNASGVLVPITFKASKIKVEEVGDEVADDVNGDDRSEFQIVVSGYKVTLTLYTADTAMLDAFLDDQANNDNQNTQYQKAMSFRFALHNGTRVAYIAKQGSRSPFSFEYARKDRVMLDTAVRFRYFNKVQAI